MGHTGDGPVGSSNGRDRFDLTPEQYHAGVDMKSDAEQRLKTLGPKALLLEGIEAMINGAVGGLMVNLGHSVQCDPALDHGYGQAAVEVALDALLPDKAD